ncbi:MAG: bifunctional phosphoribosylaminoimidazolecarboxamide formyltransferase/IMP cyclohydrolase [Acidiferrobacteraceae bacterium]
MDRPDGARPERALLSVSDKTGLVEFAKALADLGIELLSTGGTARALAASGLAVREVSEYTGFPELMDGRLKTLHPRVHGGLLARRGVAEDAQAMALHGIRPIDLLVVNLYPFEQTVEREGCPVEEAVEQIDIGGPAMLRSAAKNHRDVTAIVDPADYRSVIHELRAHGMVSAALRRSLAAKVFRRLSAYDAAIARYLEPPRQDLFPETLSLTFERIAPLRYGENPHQRAAVYGAAGERGVARARQVQGKDLSFNNLLDADAAWNCVRSFARSACVIVKHGNPCGVAERDHLEPAYDAAYATDPSSAFGGVIAFNAPLDAPLVSRIIGRQFVEVLIAPAVSEAAVEALRAKPNVRVLVAEASPPVLDLRRIGGGLLVQEQDVSDMPQWRVVSRRSPSDSEATDLAFAWRVAKFVKSNAIVYARDGATLGVGAGQMSRVDSARIAARKAEDAGLSLAGSCVASDAFFPFRDGVDQAAAAGACAVIQPGGSVRDEEVIAAADEHGLAMVFTGMRHFRH